MLAVTLCFVIWVSVNFISFGKKMDDPDESGRGWVTGWFEATTDMLHYRKRVHITVQTSCMFFPRLSRCKYPSPSFSSSHPHSQWLKLPHVSWFPAQQIFPWAKLQSDAGDRLLCLTNVPQLEVGHGAWRSLWESKKRRHPRHGGKMWKIGPWNSWYGQLKITLRLECVLCSDSIKIEP